MKKQIKTNHKPTIETLINTAALALTSYGVVQITSGNWEGYLAIIFGMGLEFFKYWGRDKYW